MSTADISCNDLLSQMDITLLQSNEYLSEANLISIKLESEAANSKQQETNKPDTNDRTTKELAKLQKLVKKLKSENKEQEEYIQSLQDKHKKEQKILQTQIDLSEKHIETLQQNLNSHKNFQVKHLQASTQPELRRGSLPIQFDDNGSSNGSQDLSNPSTVHAIAKSQHFLVAKKNQEIASLQREIEQLKYQIEGNSESKKNRTDSSSAERIIDLEGQVRTQEETIKNLKNRYANFCVNILCTTFLLILL